MNEESLPVSERTYLGDGVYAQVERGMIRLSTWDGFGETNTIYLEPFVYDALLYFAAARGWSADCGRSADCGWSADCGRSADCGFPICPADRNVIENPHESQI